MRWFNGGDAGIDDADSVDEDGDFLAGQWRDDVCIYGHGGCCQPRYTRGDAAAVIDNDSFGYVRRAIAWQQNNTIGNEAMNIAPTV